MMAQNPSPSSGEHEILTEVTAEEPSESGQGTEEMDTDDATCILKGEDKMQHIATINELQNAAENQLRLSRLILDNCYTRAGKGGISLKSGELIPTLSSIETLEVREANGSEKTVWNVVDLLEYGQRCRNLETLIFVDCLLPLTFNDDFASRVMSSALKVLWRPSEHEFSFDCQKRKWKLRSSEESSWLSCDSYRFSESKTVTDLCRHAFQIEDTDSIELQRTWILLLEIASSHHIPTRMCLSGSLDGFQGDDIRLNTGLCLSSLSSLEKIYLNMCGKAFKDGELTGMINFGMKSERFKLLAFAYADISPYVNPADIRKNDKARNDVRVITIDEVLSLDMENGTWKPLEDIETIKEMCSSGVTINKYHEPSVHKRTVELLVKATDHGISIEELVLAGSFAKTNEEGDIILSSGITLPDLKTLTNMQIMTARGRMLTEREVDDILNFILQNKRLRYLRLLNCVVPSTVHLLGRGTLLRYRGVKVLWIPDSDKYEQLHVLDLRTGLFVACRPPQTHP